VISLIVSVKNDVSQKCIYCKLITSAPQFAISADMLESVNKKTLIHPLYKVGISIVKGLPEEARLNSDG
jgi:hypothetical protein